MQEDVKRALEAMSAVPSEHPDCAGVCAESPMSACRGECLRVAKERALAFHRAMPARWANEGVLWTPDRIMRELEE